MPRPREIVMKGISAADSHDAAIARAIKLYSPYTVVDGELVGSDEPYAVVFTAPRGGDRKVIATRNRKANAISLRDMLLEAWAEGFYSSGVVQGS